MQEKTEQAEWLGYCSNVHAGTSLEQTRQNLQQYTLEVKRKLDFEHPMGVGLWLSSAAAGELANTPTCHEFRDWLGHVGLVPFTFNGFPFGNFHQDRVKRAVYRPTWAATSRLDYTVSLARIMNEILPPGIDGTISTLPLGWPEANQIADVAIGPRDLADRSQRAVQRLVSSDFLSQVRLNLDRLAEQLELIEQQSDRRIMVCLEPEPGCLIETADDLCRFFDSYLLNRSAALDARTRRYLGVCHDICHSAVMFEPQSSAIDQYQQLELEIGKVQVSSALKVINKRKLNQAAEARQLKATLQTFSEPRYLHQSVIHYQDRHHFFEDLPNALEHIEKIDLSEPMESSELELRIHFHVPIFLNEINGLGTTQQEIFSFKQAIAQRSMAVKHWEIETYAWNVLPEQWKCVQLSDGIVREWKWLHENWDAGIDCQLPSLSD